MIDTKDFSPALAELLGDGSALRAEAVATGSEQAGPVHLLMHLARSPGSVLRVQLLEAQGVDPVEFCRQLHAVSSGEEQPFSLEAVWRDFPSGGGERALLKVLLPHTKVGAALLEAVAGSPEAMQRFLSRPDKQEVVKALGGEGQILRGSFDPSGQRVLNVLREELAALGRKRPTALHLLYALAGMGGGVLQRAIMFQGIDPVRDVHGNLARELARPGAKRASDVDLRPVSEHDAWAKTLELAALDATREGSRIGELHLTRALVAFDQGMVAGWLASRRVRLDLLREFLLRVEPDESETEDGDLVPLDRIESVLVERILGQPHAVKVTLPWIKRLRFGYPRERGTAGVMLFIGPSGTGKTELAKEIARTVYGSPDRLLHLEMSQFQTEISINNFIGAPPGYVGYGEGKLTTGLRDKAPCVVLFDEIDKARGTVFTALLRFLDEGLISDPAGPARDGRGCIVVLTGNIGDQVDTKVEVDEETGRPTPRGEQFIRQLVLKHVERPEIYNRIDEKVVFRSLERDTFVALVRRQVDTERDKFAQRGTEVTVGEEVLEWLTDRAMEFGAEGARAVPRLVSRYLIGPIIDQLHQETVAAAVEVVLAGTGTAVKGKGTS